MRVAPKKLTRSLLLLPATLALLTGSASAQNPLMPGISLGKEQKRQLTARLYRGRHSTVLRWPYCCFFFGAGTVGVGRTLAQGSVAF
jgi:hypothetical protein